MLSWLDHVERMDELDTLRGDLVMEGLSMTKMGTFGKKVRSRLPETDKHV